MSGLTPLSGVDSRSGVLTRSGTRLLAARPVGLGVPLGPPGSPPVATVNVGAAATGDAAAVAAPAASDATAAVAGLIASQEWLRIPQDQRDGYSAPQIQQLADFREMWRAAAARLAEANANLVQSLGMSDHIGSAMVNSSMQLKRQLDLVPATSTTDPVLRLLFDAAMLTDADVKAFLNNVNVFNPQVLMNVYMWLAFANLMELDDQDIEGPGGILTPFTLSFKGYLMEYCRATEEDVQTVLQLFRRILLSFTVQPIAEVRVLRVFLRVNKNDLDQAALELTALHEKRLNLAPRNAAVLRRLQDPANSVLGLSSAMAAQITKAVGGTGRAAEDDDGAPPGGRKRPREDSPARCHKCHMVLGENETCFAEHRKICPRRNNKN